MAIEFGQRRSSLLPSLLSSLLSFLAALYNMTRGIPISGASALLAAHRSLHAAHRSLFTVYGPLLTVRRSRLTALLTAYCSPLTALHCPLFTITAHYFTSHGSRITVHCPLFTAHSALLIAHCSLLTALFTAHCSLLHFSLHCSLSTVHDHCSLLHFSRSLRTVHCSFALLTARHCLSLLSLCSLLAAHCLEVTKEGMHTHRASAPQQYADTERWVAEFVQLQVNKPTRKEPTWRDTSFDLLVTDQLSSTQRTVTALQRPEEQQGVDTTWVVGGAEWTQHVPSYAPIALEELRREVDMAMATLRVLMQTRRLHDGVKHSAWYGKLISKLQSSLRTTITRFNFILAAAPADIVDDAGGTAFTRIPPYKSGRTTEELFLDCSNLDYPANLDFEARKRWFMGSKLNRNVST
jgi:hypothetical protein